MVVNKVLLFLDFFLHFHCIFLDYGSSGNKDVKTGTIQTGLRSQFEDAVNTLSKSQSTYLFSCTSSSNRRVKLKKNEKNKRVNFEKCLINQGKAFDLQTSQFQAQEDGLYQFSATFLMKTDFGGQVQVGLKLNDQVVNQALLQSAKGMKIGTTNSLSNNLKLSKGDTVQLELMAADGSGGLINSDWLVLKFWGYKRDSKSKSISKGQAMESMELQDFKEPGFYKISFNGLLEACSQESGGVSYSLEKDSSQGRLSTVTSVSVGSMLSRELVAAQTSLNILLPFSTQVS